MKTNKLAKMVMKGINNGTKFRGLSDRIIAENFMKNVDDDHKEALSKFISENFAVGAEYVKNKNLLTGAIFGAVGTGLTLMIGNKIKRMTEKEYMVWFKNIKTKETYTIVHAVDEAAAKAEVEKHIKRAYGEDCTIVEVIEMD